MSGLTNVGVQVRLSACVMDGISIGHARCNTDHCTQRLASPRDRFCSDHAHLAHQCAIQGCSQAVADGMRTCRTKEHRAFEIEKRERGQAIFRLKRRLDGHNSNAADLLAPGTLEVTVILTRVGGWFAGLGLTCSRACRLMIPKSSLC